MSELTVQQDDLNNIVSSMYQRAFANADTLDGIYARVEDVSVILETPEVYIKQFALLDFLGKSRFNTNEEMWRKRRDITQPAYVAASREPIVARVATIFSECFEAIETPSVQAIAKACERAAMRVFLNALGCRGDPSRFVDFLPRLRNVLVELQHASWRSISEDERIHLEVLAQDAISDFLDLLDASGDTRQLVDQFSLRIESDERRVAAEELLMNMFAGVETTTATIGWILDRVGVNMRVQERLFAELMAGDGETLYRRCFIHETLRYFPPIPFVTREVATNTNLNGQVLQKGQQVLVSIVGVHHDARFWEDPQTFDAGRKSFVSNSFNRSSFIPFLQGPRTCGGMKLAGLEIAAALDQILTRFKVTNAAPGVAFDYSLAMRPKLSAGLSAQWR